ncbi:hypothetical protein PR048_001647 [Dryococelus australis]|uniref:Uncharacterized protein n=1 Tax=Dryococelus australis TaxID=614101 RepID=A0ABQ9IKE9_9NEOP|nr:hypothetical protein PR048_001647 [Dryococelus australis]
MGDSAARQNSTTRRRRRRRRQRVWMHPITAERLESGQFYTIMSELKEDDSKFFNYFRTSHKSFEYLLNLLKMNIEKVDMKMRRIIPAEERLAIQLR